MYLEAYPIMMRYSLKYALVSEFQKLISWIWGVRNGRVGLISLTVN